MSELTKEQKRQLDDVLRPIGYTAVKLSDFMSLYARHETLLQLENRIGGHIVRDYEAEA